jgi:acetyl-CoA acetyltransferase
MHHVSHMITHAGICVCVYMYNMFDASLESLGGVKPIQEGGIITAANASQICDGASGMTTV